MSRRNGESCDSAFLISLNALELTWTSTKETSELTALPNGYKANLLTTQPRI